MIKHETRKIVSIYTLVEELKKRYNIKVSRPWLAKYLYDSDYTNDCYKEFYFGDGPVDFKETDEDAKEIRILNYIIKMLTESFPTEDRILIEIWW